MTDEEALLATVIANPDDTLPRLVYADWIEERGYPERAELIRVQVRHAQTEHGSPEFWNLIGRSAELLALNRARWKAEFSQHVAVESLDFRNGLPEIVVLSAAEFLRAGDHLFRMAPIREVHVRDSDSQVLELCRAPRPAGVRVRTTSWTEDATIVDFLRPHPAEMETLLRTGNWVVLCLAVWSGPDHETASRLIQRFSYGWQYGFGGHDVAIRSFNDPSEFARWCPVALPVQSPLWLTLENGQVTDTHVGLQCPERFLSDFEYDANH